MIFSGFLIKSRGLVLLAFLADESEDKYNVKKLNIIDKIAAEKKNAAD